MSEPSDPRGGHTAAAPGSAADDDARGTAAVAVEVAPPGELPSEFGRYRIERKLGRGGMGSVYLARDRELDRLVALKVPRFAADEDPASLERFRREARAAATLNHPNICAVYDAGEVQGIQYLTMAYVEGRPLSDLLQPGTPLPERPAADLLRKLALALDEAHRHGVVHRDLKPSNIMINRRHEPVITDFGLARRDQPGEEQLTRSGTILGTPAYMSPEQVEGDTDRIGPASDVYSLGVMFYELLTGARPFQGSVASIFSQILRDEPRRPSELRPGLDATLEAVCLKAMSKSPAARYTMDELASALDAYLARTAPRDGSAASGGAATLTQAIPPARPAEPQSETMPLGGAPTATVPEAPAAAGPGLATQLLAQLEARLEQDRTASRAAEDRWWRNPLLPWLAAAVVLLGLLVVLSTWRSGDDRTATIRIDLAGLEQLRADPSIVVLLNGRELSEAELSRAIRVAPGEHEVAIRRGGEIVATQTFSVAGGGEPQPVSVVSGAAGIQVVVPGRREAPPAGASGGRPGPAVVGPGGRQVRPGDSGRAQADAPPLSFEPQPPEPVDASLALWSERYSQHQPNPLHAEVQLNERPPVRIEADLQLPIAADLRPGWNRLSVETTPAADARAANHLKFLIGPVARNNAGNPVMSPVLWSFHNGDDWLLRDGRHRHRIDPEAKSVRLELPLYYAGLKQENLEPKDGDYVVVGEPGSAYRLPSVTATVFVNGTGLNTFTTARRQVVITPLLRRGHNEIRIVSARVENCLADNDVWVLISGPAEWNASRNRFQTRPIAAISGMTGWRRNSTTSRLENTVDPASATIEREIPLYLSDEPARAGRFPGGPTMAVWSERSSAYHETGLHSEVRVNGRLAGVFTSDARETLEPLLKQGDWNDIEVLTRARHPNAGLRSLAFNFGPARRGNDGDLVMSPVLWSLSNGDDWRADDDRLRHRLDPDATEVTLSTRLFYAGLESESLQVARGDYVLTAQPASIYRNPSVTATVFVNGTPLNSFTAKPRQVVITRLLKEGDNEVRIVTVPVKNVLQDNDLSLSIGGPARYNVSRQDYDFSPIMEFTAQDGWRRDPASGQLVAGDDPQQQTVERVLRFRITGLSSQEQ